MLDLCIYNTIQAIYSRLPPQHASHVLKTREARDTAKYDQVTGTRSHKY